MFEQNDAVHVSAADGYRLVVDTRTNAVMVYVNGALKVHSIATAYLASVDLYIVSTTNHFVGNEAMLEDIDEARRQAHEMSSQHEILPVFIWKWVDGKFAGCPELFVDGERYTTACYHHWIAVDEFEEIIHTGETGAWHQDQVCPKCLARRRVGVDAYEGEHYEKVEATKWVGEIPLSPGKRRSVQQHDGTYVMDQIYDAVYESALGNDTDHDPLVLDEIPF